MTTLVDERQVIRVRDRNRRMTVEMLITDFEFTPASSVESILNELAGIERVSVESGSGKTTVTFAPEEVALAEIVDAVGGAGFSTVVTSVSSEEVGTPTMRDVRAPIIATVKGG